MCRFSFFRRFLRLIRSGDFNGGKGFRRNHGAGICRLILSPTGGDEQACAQGSHAQNCETHTITPELNTGLACATQCVSDLWCRQSCLRGESRPRMAYRRRIFGLPQLPSRKRDWIAALVNPAQAGIQRRVKAQVERSTSTDPWKRQVAPRKVVPTP